MAKEMKTKKVIMDHLEHSSLGGSLTQLNPYERMLTEVQKLIEARDKLEVLEISGDGTVNVTPKQLQPSFERSSNQLGRYNAKIFIDPEVHSFKSNTSSAIKSKTSKAVAFQMSVDDVIEGIGADRIILEDEPEMKRYSGSITTLPSSASFLFDSVPKKMKRKARMQFIRIILRKTELQLLYEQQGMTSIKNTEDGNYAEMDNKQYDYLTIGRGKIRRRSEAEAQTFQTLYKSREVNTKTVQTNNVGSYVSYYEMFDTYEMIDDIQFGVYDDIPKKLHMSKTDTPEQQFAIIAQLPSFGLASGIMKRFLAGNTFEQGQRRFRNMFKISRTVEKIDYKYSLNQLFVINPAFQDKERKAVADLSFCYTNSDILAVAYGIYSYRPARLPKKGEVCVWSIKNPCDPERSYRYKTPVISVEFSPYTQTLLAVGLFNGLVEVRDISRYNQPPLAVSTRATSPGIDPVLVIKWLKQSTYGDNEELDPFLALSQNGSVTQYRIINSPFLLGVKLMALKRLEGLPEGLPGIIPAEKIMQHSNRSPQGLGLTKHPIQLDIYYMLTDEGCIYKCSTNYQQQYIQALKTHEGSVNHMDFSPWSSKLFLTCGNDWCLRIWMEGIFEPLITLKNSCKPYNWAIWSRTHSTILIALSGHQCEIWDLRRNILKPMSTIILNTSNNTTGIFSLDGKSLLIGKERGQVLVCALDEFPFPTYCQYDTLEKAIYKAMINKPDLLTELKSFGYFGNPNKEFIKSS